MRDWVRENAGYLWLLAVAGSVLLGHWARAGGGKEPGGPRGGDEVAGHLVAAKTEIEALRREVGGLKLSAVLWSGDPGLFGIGTDWRPGAAVPDVGLRADALGVALDGVEAAVDAAIAAQAEAGPPSGPPGAPTGGGPRSPGTWIRAGEAAAASRGNRRRAAGTGVTMGGARRAAGGAPPSGGSPVRNRRGRMASRAGGRSRAGDKAVPGPGPVSRPGRRRAPRADALRGEREVKNMPYRCRGCGRRAAYELLPPASDSLKLPTYWCGRCWESLCGEPLVAWELAREARVRRRVNEGAGCPADEGDGGARPTEGRPG